VLEHVGEVRLPGIPADLAQVIVSTDPAVVAGFATGRAQAPVSFEHGDGGRDPAAALAVPQVVVQVSLAGPLVRLRGQQVTEAPDTVIAETVDAAGPAAGGCLVRPSRDRFPRLVLAAGGSV
jgi:hypothetical protein